MTVSADTDQIRELQAEIGCLKRELALRDAVVDELTATAARLNEAERQLKQHERDIRSVLDNLPSMIGYWDTSLHNRFANHAYSTWFGMDHRTIPGKHVREVIGEERFRLNLPYIEAALRGEEQIFERAIPTPDGSAIRHSLAHYIPDEADGVVQGFFVLVSDISAIKEVELALQRTNADLEEFAYVASHDLREPLRMISIYMALLERRYGATLDADARDFISFALDGAKRMDRMVLDLLEFSRVGRAEDHKPVSLDEIVATAVKNLGPAASESNAKIVVDGGLPLVTGSPTELERLFQNLIGNALKYRAPGRKPVVSVTCRPGPQEWTFVVTDNGIGIDPEYFERVFSVFQRLHTHDQYEGTGIGLAICRKVVQRHGGRIWVESEPGKGSSFLFTLPRTPA